MMSPKKILWGCSLCHNRQNPSKVSACTTCGAIREQERFGISINGEFFICKVNTALFRTTVTVYCLLTDEHYTAILLNSENELIERVRATIIHHSESRISTPINFDDTKKKTVPHIVRPSNMSLFDSVIFNASTLAYDGKIGQYIPIASIQTSDLPIDEACDASFISETAIHAQTGATISFDSAVNQSVVERQDSGKTADIDSQCDPVTNNGTSLLETTDDSRPCVYKSDSNIVTNLRYITSMLKERTDMTAAVSTLKERRNEIEGLYDDVDIRTAKERAGCITSHSLDSTLVKSLNDRNLRACPVCEYHFPKNQLPGKISYKAISVWKAEHNVGKRVDGHTQDTLRLHDTANICLFCTQFFDSNCVENSDQKSILSKTNLESLDIKGSLNCSNKVYKQMFNQLLITTKQDATRPLSRIKHRVALAHLKLKAESNIVHEEKLKKSGSYLRDKYSEANGLLLIEKRKQEHLATMGHMHALKLEQESASIAGITLHSHLVPTHIVPKQHFNKTGGKAKGMFEKASFFPTSVLIGSDDEQSQGGDEFGEVKVQQVAPSLGKLKVKFSASSNHVTVVPLFTPPIVTTPSPTEPSEMPKSTVKNTRRHSLLKDSLPSSNNQDDSSIVSNSSKMSKVRSNKSLKSTSNRSSKSLLSGTTPSIVENVRPTKPRVPLHQRAQSMPVLTKSDSKANAKTSKVGGIQAKLKACKSVYDKPERSMQSAKKTNSKARQAFNSSHSRAINDDNSVVTSATKRTKVTMKTATPKQESRIRQKLNKWRLEENYNSLDDCSVLSQDSVGSMDSVSRVKSDKPWRKNMKMKPKKVEQSSETTTPVTTLNLERKQHVIHSQATASLVPIVPIHSQSKERKPLLLQVKSKRGNEMSDVVKVFELSSGVQVPTSSTSNVIVESEQLIANRDHLLQSLAKQKVRMVVAVTDKGQQPELNNNSSREKYTVAENNGASNGATSFDLPPENETADVDTHESKYNKKTGTPPTALFKQNRHSDDKTKVIPCQPVAIRVVSPDSHVSQPIEDKHNIIQGILNHGPPVQHHIPLHPHHTVHEEHTVSLHSGRKLAPSLLPPRDTDSHEQSLDTRGDLHTPSFTADSCSEQYTPYTATYGQTPSNENFEGASIYDYLNNADHQLLFSDVQANSSSNTLFIHDSPDLHSRDKKQLIGIAQKSPCNEEADPYAGDMNDFEPIDCIRIKTCSEFGTRSPLLSNASYSSFISLEGNHQDDLPMYDSPIQDEPELSLSRKLFSADDVVAEPLGESTHSVKKRLHTPRHQPTDDTSQSPQYSADGDLQLMYPEQVEEIGISPAREDEEEGHFWDGEDGFMDNYNWVTGGVYQPHPMDENDLGFSPEKRRKSIELLESPKWSNRFGATSAERIRNKDAIERIQLLSRGDRNELHSAVQTANGGGGGLSRNSSRRQQSKESTGGLFTVLTPRETTFNSNATDEYLSVRNSAKLSSQNNNSKGESKSRKGVVRIEER